MHWCLQQHNRQHTKKGEDPLDNSFLMRGSLKFLGHLILIKYRLLQHSARNQSIALIEMANKSYKHCQTNTQQERRSKQI